MKDLIPAHCKVIILTAPSGSGKTTLVKELLKRYDKLEFSISACTRSPRPGEVDGVDYYFLDAESFKTKIEKNEFVEWEMVYEGKYYGTLKSEMERIWQLDKYPLIDIDVQGALNVKTFFPENSLSLFIQPPSVQVLKERLEKRGTETPDAIQERLNKSVKELEYANRFDKIIINDHLDTAVQNTVQIIEGFIK
jgi:guanylate kinase